MRARTWLMFTLSGDGTMQRRKGNTLILILIGLIAIGALIVSIMAFMRANHANASGRRLTVWAQEDLTPFVRHGMEHFHPTDPPSDHIPPPPPPPDWDDDPVGPGGP